jgi:hypothetical protein
MKIVTELYRREMSPSQWLLEFGGGSYGKIHWHFKRLEEHGWLRRVRESKTAEGRGRHSHLYRSTELAVIDDETWLELPTSIQVAFTARCLRLLGERIGGALARGAVDGPDHGSLFESRTEFVDDQAWSAAMAAMADCFFALTHEQQDAKVRLATSSEEGVLLTMALVGFESPGAKPRRSRSGPDLEIGDRHPLKLGDFGELPLSTRMAKVFGDPINLEILRTLTAGPPLSPSQLYAKIGGASQKAFGRRCRGLADLGWAVRLNGPSDPPPILYTAAGPQAFDADLWGSIPSAAERAPSWPIFDSFCIGAEEALREGSFNARQDRHVTFCTFLLDAHGRRQVSRAMSRCTDRLEKAVADAADRAGSRSRPPCKVNFLLARFEDPDGDCDC